MFFFGSSGGKWRRDSENVNNVQQAPLTSTTRTDKVTSSSWPRSTSYQASRFNYCHPTPKTISSLRTKYMVRARFMTGWKLPASAVLLILFIVLSVLIFVSRIFVGEGFIYLGEINKNAGILIEMTCPVLRKRDATWRRIVEKVRRFFLGTMLGPGGRLHGLELLLFLVVVAAFVSNKLLLAGGFCCWLVVTCWIAVDWECTVMRCLELRTNGDKLTGFWFGFIEVLPLGRLNSIWRWRPEPCWPAFY